MKKKLMVLLMILVVALSSCARVIHKEYEIVDGKSVVRSNTEYDRIGDQNIVGGEASKVTPDGTNLSIKFDQQKSEGKLQIEGLISAAADLAAVLLDKGLPGESAQAQSIADGLKAVNQ